MNIVPLRGFAFGWFSGLELMQKLIFRPAAMLARKLK